MDCNFNVSKILMKDKVRFLKNVLLICWKSWFIEWFICYNGFGFVCVFLLLGIVLVC